MAATAEQVAKDLVPLKTENDPELCETIRNMVQKFASLLPMRTKYLAVIPWRFATAREAEGAKVCLRQLRDTPAHRLDPLSKRIADTLLDDLERVALGHPVSPALMKEIKRIWKTPLDESAGEGYHRDTNLVHSRAPAATTTTVVQEVRVEHGRNRVEQVIRDYKKPGRDMLRYEWNNWKRILQFNPQLAHRGVKLGESAAFRRIYRQSDFARESWDTLLDARHADPPLPFEDNVDAVQREYVSKTFRQCAYYSIRREVKPIADGAAAAPPAEAPPQTQMLSRTSRCWPFITAGVVRN